MSLGADTHTHTNMHTNFADEINFKKPGMRQPKAGTPGFIKNKSDDFAM